MEKANRVTRPEPKKAETAKVYQKPVEVAPVDIQPQPPQFSGKEEDFPDWVRADMVWKQQHHEWHHRQLNVKPPIQPVTQPFKADSAARVFPENEKVAKNVQAFNSGKDAALNANTKALDTNTKAVNADSEAINANSK